MSEIQPYAVLGRTWRWGITEDGRPFAVAADVALSFDHRDGERVSRLLDDDEKGTQIVGTPGGPQEMKVIYEDGIWELVFRSRKPEALAIKKRVKEILRGLREGTLALVPRPRRELSNRDLALMVIEEADRADAAEARAAALAPAAEAWEALADAEGSYSVADVAKILANAGVHTGQNRLFKQLQDLSWVYRAGDRAWRAYQRSVDAGWLREKPNKRWDHDLGQEVTAAPQVRITIKGLNEIRRRLTGGRPIPVQADLFVSLT